MTSLAHLVANANVQRLALIGLAKNVGKTTTANYLLKTLLDERLYAAQELAITSLGLDGEATDALTGLPKPRYVPEAGLLVATTAALLRQAENEGIHVERLLQLPGRTALGPIILARVLKPGRVIIAGPTLLRDVCSTFDQFQNYGTRLGIIDGAINRLGAASPSVTAACIVCTGTSVGATPELVARRTAAVLAQLMTPESRLSNAYRKLHPQARLLAFIPEERISNQGYAATVYTGSVEPAAEARWVVESMHGSNTIHVFILRGAFTEELARAMLLELSTTRVNSVAELIVEDATKIFCHAVVLQRLAARGLQVRVAEVIRILAMTINPFTPEYVCSSQRLLDALLPALPLGHPPIVDVVSGVCFP